MVVAKAQSENARLTARKERYDLQAVVFVHGERGDRRARQGLDNARHSAPMPDNQGGFSRPEAGPDESNQFVEVPGINDSWLDTSLPGGGRGGLLSP